MRSPEPIRLPFGTRDFLPRAAARRRLLVELFLEEFDLWGYERVVTPMFERADVLERGLGPDASAAALRFIEPSTGSVLALRPDITPQIARLVATRLRDIEGPIRLSYQGAVTRMYGARRQVEYLQVGVELIGTGSVDEDAELLSLAAAVLQRLSGAEARLDVGHGGVVRALVQRIDDAEQKRDILTALSKKDLSGINDAAASLGIKAREQLCAVSQLYGAADQVFVEAQSLALPSPARAAIRRLTAVFELARETLSKEQLKAITVDLGEVRGFEYYTGMRLAGFVRGVGDAVLLGGRYDELLGRYGHSAPATGFAIDTESIAGATLDMGDVLPRRGVLLCAAKAQRQLARKLIGAARQRGRRIALDTGRPRNRTTDIAYAQAVGFLWLARVREQDASVVNLSTGDERRMSVVSLRRWLCADERD